MELVSLRCNRDFTSASSYGLGWYKYAIATQWYQFHTTDAWWFSLKIALVSFSVSWQSTLFFDKNGNRNGRTTEIQYGAVIMQSSFGKKLIIIMNIYFGKYAIIYYDRLQISWTTKSISLTSQIVCLLYPTVGGALNVWPSGNIVMDCLTPARTIAWHRKHSGDYIHSWCFVAAICVLIKFIPYC